MTALLLVTSLHAIMDYVRLLCLYVCSCPTGGLCFCQLIVHPCPFRFPLYIVRSHLATLFYCFTFWNWNITCWNWCMHWFNTTSDSSGDYVAINSYLARVQCGRLTSILIVGSCNLKCLAHVLLMWNSCSILVKIQVENITGHDKVQPTGTVQSSLYKRPVGFSLIDWCYLPYL
jgi:hypothetical protein